MNLWNDCEKKPITELLEFIVDNRGKTVPTTETGHILIATNCIKNDSLYPKYEKIRFLSQETYETFFRSHPLPGDIIFVNKGTPGRVCLVPEPVNFCIAQDMIALRANKKKVDNHYLFAVLRSPMIQAQIHNTYVGDVIPHFKKQFMDRLLIPIPSMAIQKKIGDIYYTLCDKIEVNRRINEQLEELAGALFKSWFVDFEPFKDSEFEDSELGMIPKGWKVGKFTDIVEIKGGGTPKTDIAEYWNGDIPFFTPKDINDVFCIDTEKNITDLGLLKCSSKLYCKNTVFITARGTVGKVCMAGRNMAMNQTCYALIGKEKYGQHFIYMQTINIVERMKKKANGAVFSAITTRDFDSEKIIIPSLDVVNDFLIKIEPLYESILHNQQEITHLTTLRDTLLPKLMSGEIDVNEVKI